MKVNLSWALGCVVLMVSAARGQVTGYEGLTDWSSLPLARTGVVAGLSSSANPLGPDGAYDLFDCGNYRSDYPGYIGPAGGASGLMLDVAGPGVLTRFWEPTTTADYPTPLTITVDGTYVFNTTAQALLEGNFGGGPDFRAPLVTGQIGGQVSYEPITFNQSLKIETTAPFFSHFYQINYQLLPAGTTIPSYNGTRTASQITARAAAVTLLGNIGQNPAGADPSATFYTPPSQPLAAGSSLTLASLSGSGQVRALRLSLRDGTHTPTDAQLDGLRLRIRFDGAADYAVDVPVSQFFGVGHGRADYQSLPQGVAGDGTFYSYWPMPYRQGASVELVNTTGTAIDLLGASVEAVTGPVSSTADYFHAVYHEQVTTAGQLFYSMLNVTGSGHYVGNLLYFEGGPGAGVANLIEGNEEVIADGRLLPGTGVEDAYNGGYGYTVGGLVQTSGIAPYSGLLDNTASRIDQYRWLIPDAVPFTDGLVVEEENFLKSAGATFGSTAFYYSADAPEPASLLLLLISAAGLLGRRRYGA